MTEKPKYMSKRYEYLNKNVIDMQIFGQIYGIQRNKATNHIKKDALYQWATIRVTRNQLEQN